jgi:hypothetical protein
MNLRPQLPLLVIVLGFLVAGPALIYLAVEHTVHIHTEGQRLLVMLLGGAGLAGFAWYSNR